MSEQVNEPTEREQLVASIRADVERYKKAGWKPFNLSPRELELGVNVAVAIDHHVLAYEAAHRNDFSYPQPNVRALVISEFLSIYAAEVRAAERARWEAAAREAVEYFGMFKESAVKCGCPECKQARALMDKFAALLKDNKNMNNPEHAIPERGNV